MWKTDSWTRDLKTAALAALLCLGVSGCGGDGPSGPKSVSLPDLFGDQLFRGDGTTVSVQSLQGTALLGIYFASPTCPACGGFTPLLLEAYTQLREDGRSFEIILVSPGISDATLLTYMEESGMVWLAVSSRSKQANTLVQRFNVRWIPTLVVIDSEGNIVSLSGREEVTVHGAGAYDGWLAARVGG